MSYLPTYIPTQYKGGASIGQPLYTWLFKKGKGRWQLFVSCNSEIPLGTCWHSLINTQGLGILLALISGLLILPYDILPFFMKEYMIIAELFA